jgi:hypothetical protein
MVKKGVADDDDGDGDDEPVTSTQYFTIINLGLRKTT